MSHRINKLQLAFLAAGSLTCGGTEPGDEAQPPAAIRVVSGGAQVGTVGTKLANPIVVQVLDDAGHPASGWVITFAVTTGGGTIFPTSSQTDGDGYAATTWTIGSAAGTAIHGMTATVEINSQVSVSATASGVAGPATQIIPLRGDSQFTDLSTTLDTLSARISDRFGNYASGQDVTWSASTGVVRAVDQLSDSLGIVRAVWKTGTLSGSQSARASITGTNVGTGFTARIRPGPATGIAIYSGTSRPGLPHRVSSSRSRQRRSIPTAMAFPDHRSTGPCWGVAVNCPPQSRAVIPWVLPGPT